MESVNVFVLVHCENDVVDVRNESLKPCFVVFVWRPCFSVNRGVPVAEFVVSLGCEKGFPIVCAEHFRCLIVYSIFPRRGTGKGRIDLIGVAYSGVRICLTGQEEGGCPSGAVIHMILPPFRHVEIAIFQLKENGVALSMSP